MTESGLDARRGDGCGLPVGTARAGRVGDPRFDLYGPEFFERNDSGMLRSARAVFAAWPGGPWGSVADVGCGRGMWLKAAREAGASVCVGYDGPWVEPDGSFPWTFRAIDLERRMPLPGFRPEHDLCLCLEVAEHLTPGRAEPLVAAVRALAPVTLFSAATPGQGGDGHLNERGHRYWTGLFAAHGRRVDRAATTLLRGLSGVEWWYARNFLVFRER